MNIFVFHIEATKVLGHGVSHQDSEWNFEQSRGKALEYRKHWNREHPLFLVVAQIKRTQDKDICSLFPWPFSSLSGESYLVVVVGGGAGDSFAGILNKLF